MFPTEAGVLLRYRSTVKLLQIVELRNESRHDSLLRMLGFDKFINC